MLAAEMTPEQLRQYDPERVAAFFAFANERHAIYLRRQTDAKAPFTEDTILQRYSFCNVFRDLDATSAAIYEWCAEPGLDVYEQFRAIVIGRLVNTAANVQRFRAAGLASAYSREAMLAELSRTTLGVGYRIATPRGFWNHEGICDMIEAASERALEVMNADGIKEALVRLDGPGKQCLGGFIGYQMVLDLAHLGLVPDDGYTEIGPGAARGIALICGAQVGSAADRQSKRLEKRRDVYPVLEEGCHYLLEQSRTLWHYERPWTIHDVEFTLCEWDKYMRKQAGQLTGRRFRGGKK